MSIDRRARALIAAAGAVALAAGALVTAGAPAAATGGPSTHTFVAMDKADPRAWGKASNWDDSQVPANGDIVIIDGKSVTGVPSDKAFTQVTLINGAQLATGGPLTTGVLTAGCAISNVDLMVATLGDVYGLDLEMGTEPDNVSAPVYTNLGVTTVRQKLVLDSGCTIDTLGHAGKMRLFGTSSLVNIGTLMGNGTVQGMTCCTKPQVVENRLEGVIDGTNTLTLADLRLVDRGVIQNGIVVLDGGDHYLTSSTRIGPGTLLGSGALINANGLTPMSASQITINAGGILSLQGQSTLVGRGIYLGAGRIALKGGAMEGSQRLQGTVGLTIDGPDAKWIGVSTGIDHGEVRVLGGPLRLLTGPLTVAGLLSVESAIEVPPNQQPLVKGAICCTLPVNTLGATAPVSIGANAKLRLADLGVLLTKGVSGAGTLEMGGGVLWLGTGADLKVPTSLEGTRVPLSGAPKLTSTLSVLPTTTIVGAAGVTLGGAGTLSLTGGTFEGPVALGPTVTMRTSGAAVKSIAVASSLDVGGRAVFAGAGAFRIASGSSLTVRGTTTLDQATIEAGACCTKPARASFLGAVGVTKTDVSQIYGVLTGFDGAVAINGGALSLSPLAPHFGPKSSLKLGGGAFGGFDRPAVFEPRSTLIGPGVIDGGAAVYGRLTFSTRGQLGVRGAFTLGPLSDTALRFTGTARDTIKATGAVRLRGDITLRGTGLLPRGKVVLISAGTALSGRFDVVAGAGKRKIFYGPKAFLLRP